MDTTARLSLALLGSFEVTLDGHPVTTFESIKVRALLAYLTVEAGRSHARAFLAELLWPDLPAATALTYLRHVLAKLKQAIPDAVPGRPPFLLVTRETVALNPGGDYCLDVASFTALLETCAGHLHRHSETCRACAQRRAAAVALYRGDFLDHFLLGDSVAFEEWAAIKRERLRQLMLDALARLTTYYERRGAYQDAQHFAWRRVEFDPWEDEACRQLMRVFWLSGQRNAALAHYARYRRILKQELGVEPSAETTLLYERIQHAATSSLSDASPPRPAHNLPAQTTPLVGREAELAQLADLLQQPAYRLLTLSGPGGIGKTRLALQAAAELLDDFADGVCFVALAPITDQALVIPTIAQALGVQESSAQPLLKSLTIHLRARQLLLVLDNFEHVGAAAPFIANLLGAAPQLTVLVTSREVLRLYGEHEFPVPPLTLPDLRCLPALPDLNQYEAVRLFIARAQAVHANFAVTDETAPAVAEICHRLDGLPLAIELATARIRLLSPQAMLQRLDSPLTFLTGGRRDLPARHQTLRAVIDWSYNLLPAGEQQLLARLAVFVGGWTLEMAETVCDELKIENEKLSNQVPERTFFNSQFSILNLLEALVAKSLVRRLPAEPHETVRTPRFAMLETIREYALERLDASGERATLERQHAAFYLALAEAAESHRYTATQELWLLRLDADHDNMRAALAWSQTAAASVDVGARLAGALQWFWYIRGNISEGRAWLERVLQQSTSAAPPARAKVLYGAGRLESDLGQSNTLIEQALALWRELGDKPGMADALLNLGRVAGSQGDYERSRKLVQESLDLFREQQITWGIVWALLSLADVALDQGDPGQALEPVQEALALTRSVGDTYGNMWARCLLGRLAHLQGDLVRAAMLLEESLAWLRKLGSPSRFEMLNDLGQVALDQGDTARAAALFGESLKLNWEPGYEIEITLSLVGLAGVAGALGQPARAAQLLGAAEAILASIGGSLTPVERTLFDQYAATIRAQLDDATFAAMWAEGQALTLEQAITEALTEEPAIQAHAR